MSDITGFVNIIKPTGMTSSDVVIKVKKILGTKKVGHLGTLDPAASGVLPVAVGRATKFFDYFLNKDKVYTAVVQFGKLTDTLDSFGKLIKKDNTQITAQMIEGVLPKFQGEILQTPPKFSAIKIDGKKAYELARDNVEFEIKPRKITVFSANIVENCGKNKFIFNVHCSAGTYIRTLFNDIAESLGTNATTEAIIRNKSGLFEIKNAITLGELETNKLVLKVEDVFCSKKIIEANEEVSKKLINGVSVPLSELNVNENFDEEFFISTGKKLIGFYGTDSHMTKQIVYLYEA